MAELSERIRATLADLHAELAAADELDAEARASLAAAAQEIEVKLRAIEGMPPESAGEPAGLETRMAEAARNFEASHPTLSSTLGTLADALARLGI